MDYYLPDYKLHMPVSNMRNENTAEGIESRLQKILENISQIGKVDEILGAITNVVSDLLFRKRFILSQCIVQYCHA